jgi:arginyl-tRNA synthetase
MKEALHTLIADGLKELFAVSDIPFVIEHPTDLTHGDYAINAALIVSKQLGKNPIEVAQQLAQYIEANKDATISSVSVAGPGFINISLSSEYINKQVRDILSNKESWGKNELYKHKKILVEHSSPNLFKAFHIGHVMNNAIGESIKRLSEYSGADVTTISYPSDVSLGIGKAVWILMQDGGLSKLDTFAHQTEEIAYLGECYVRGTRAYDDDQSVQPAIRAITMNVYNKVNSPEYEVYLKAKERNMEYFKSITKTLGSTFDDFIYESEAGEEGKVIVQSHIGNIFKESEGAVIYEGEQDGLHTRVFINKEGNPTYEAKDVGLLSLKFNRYNPDLSLFVTDHEQSEYFKVVITAAGKINALWKERTIHRTHGRMSFQGQKMSSRLGGVPSAQALLDVLYEELEARSNTAEDDKRAIAVAALKFAILRTMAGKNINFDPETSLSFEGDSGPYLQYSTVRAKSVLKKAGAISATMPDEWQSIDLEKILIRFPEVVQLAITEWSPHHLVGYLVQLAQFFNSWYGNTKIVDDSSSSPYKAAITDAFVQTMEHGLYLLGIEVPEKM